MNDCVMTAEDVHEDLRFGDRTDTFDGFGVRSYISAQLVTPTDLTIGAL